MSHEISDEVKAHDDERKKLARAQIDQWCSDKSEDEHCEFKRAESQFSTDKVIEYCTAIANEKGGFLVLGMTDAKPRKVTGSNAFSSTDSMNSVKLRVLEALNLRLEIDVVNHPDGRVLVVGIPSRPVGQPLNYEGRYLMRSGESLVPMNPGQLKKIFAEDPEDWFFEPARRKVSAGQVVSLLDSQAFFEMVNRPYPESQEAVLEALSKVKFIQRDPLGYEITNLGAILFAKNLSDFGVRLERKAPRVVIYDGISKFKTRYDKTGNKGFAVGFSGLVDFVYASGPQNSHVEESIREERMMFPKQALRELLANALVHQDFTIRGASVLVEMFADRVEISNPGSPSIQTTRFIDENQSRNEVLASTMRRIGICEEKGSGIDKVVLAAEDHLLPAPDFREGQSRTVSILFAQRSFSEMTQEERIRACFQHCSLKFVNNQQMSNTSLRERFDLSERKSSAVSAVIAEARTEGWIKQAETGSNSTRYARYVPFWA